MLIDATHPEETRIVVVDGAKVEEFDFESSAKRQISGNIYLAKVTRVEPSLQAAFVEYGGNRHGFLAFSEIHPDYYQIPRADREALLAAEEAEQSEEDTEEERRPAPKPKPERRRRRARGETKADAAGENATPDEGADQAAADVAAPEPETASAETAPDETAPDEAASDAEPAIPAGDGDTPAGDGDATDEQDRAAGPSSIAESAGTDDAETVSEDYAPADAQDATAGAEAEPAKPARRRRRRRGEAKEEAAPEVVAEDSAEAAPVETAPVETARAEPEAENAPEAAPENVGATRAEDETPVRRLRPRSYKIQEVIKVRQIMLVQVVKEERGNKGAALTTYLSLAGRYCVLMPNTARGGGVSRKITSADDRKKLKEIASEFDLPKGMGIIIRTAGSQRTKAEIKRDYEFLLRQWEEIRTLTLKSIAPALIYEEGSLIKRCIRDLYAKEIDEILVEGEEAYREAKDYMRMLMPSHAKAVQQYKDSTPLFSRHGVESYLASMFNPTVQLKSGGYIVIGVTEALVAIDVNSGRSTREGSIEETALKTNLEAADEVARQLRLRDLAGLIVIDFIDMDERRNNAAVEKRVKDRLASDRARIQMGRISAFGLMELSRQRLRPGMLEATTAACPHCHGTGLVRSDGNLALAILREVEEEAVRKRAAEVKVRAPVAVANYIVNQKRDHLLAIETRYGMRVFVEGDPSLVSPEHKLERQGPAPIRPAIPAAPPAIRAETAFAALEDPRGPDEGDDDDESVAEVAAPATRPGERPAPRRDDDDSASRAKRRRGKRGGRRRRREDEGANGAAGMTVMGPDGEDEPMEIADGAFGPEVGEAKGARAETDDPEPVTAGPVEDEPRTAEPRTDEPDVAATPEPAPEAEGAAPEATAAEPAPEPEAKPKRRRTRKTAEKPAADTQQAAPEPAPEPAAKPAGAPAPETAPESAVAAETGADPVVATPEPEPVVTAAEEAGAPRPKRRGWWNFGAG